MPRLACVVCFLLVALCVTAQEDTLTVTPDSIYTARVVEAETGEPLPLVGVFVSKDNNTLTNFDGEFSIKAAPEDVVRLTCIGRKTISIRAGSLPEAVKMEMLASSMSEVTVTAVEGLLLQVARQMEKAYNRRKGKEAQYFYRQTTVMQRKQDIVEAFIGARSAVNLRQLEFLSGRHGRLSRTQWEQSSVEDMNLHHAVEIGPMTKDASFWCNLVMPLRTGNEETAVRFVGRKVMVSNKDDSGLGGIEYLQKYYVITIDEMDGDDQQLYRITLRRREETTVERPIMTGTLYVERGSLRVMAFDGQVENMVMRFGQGQLRSATTIPVTLNYHIDYRYDRKFPEVADLSMQTNWGNFQTRTMLFNIEGQARLKQKKGTHARENMLGSISEAGYDSTFWAQNEIVKRTAEEAAIAAGTVDRQQAHIDSIAAYQASLPPLARLADRLTRFGRALPQEKVFVHMDNSCYFLGDTIWFAAYTRRAGFDTPSGISRVLYAELWNHDGYLVERKLVEMKAGRGSGFFALPDTLYSGYFELRAYTRWQLNWGQTEHYHVPYTEYWFYNKAMAKDFLRDYEKLYSRVFPVYDKPKEAGEFYRDMTLRPLRRYFKSAPKAPELRLSLFPEGGDLVAGVPCRVAFEAATSEGEVREGKLCLKTKDSRLKIKDDRDEEVDFVATENRGRSTFTFTPEEGRKYEIVFTSTDGTTVSETIKDVKPEGVAVQVRRDSLNTWLFGIHAAGEAACQPLGVTIMHEGQLEYFQETTIMPSVENRVGSYTFSIHDSLLHVGVNQVTVFDSLGHVHADRLFFVTKPEQTRPTLSITGVKDQYQPYEEINLEINDERLNGEDERLISLSVRDIKTSDNTFDSGNIMTEMLLSSEIKGFVPQPEYFFEADDDEHRRALDLLMLTQGWRRFSWREMAVKGAFELTHPAEHTQIVTGTVNNYHASTYGFEPNLDIVNNEHANFLMGIDSSGVSTTSGIQDSHALTIQDLDPQARHSNGSNNSIANPSYGWNMNPLNRNTPDFLSASSTSSPFMQQSQWRNNDYNVLNYRTTDTYRHNQRMQTSKVSQRYLEEGNLRKEVRIHAEFASLYDEKDFITGETETRHGRFQIDLPRFDGQCVFFLSASDTTKWRKGEPHLWVQVDPINEFTRTPSFPEFYVRLNYHYPRWVKPYTYYQVHNAPLRDSTFLPSQLTTDGVRMLEQVTVRARHGGLRRIDYSKPAYVIDALEALNLAMDAGLIDYTFSPYEVGEKAARALISDMGMNRNYEINTSEDSQPGLFRGPLEQIRYNRLPFIDKFYIYTDYSPRREGDERYEQDNQPTVRVDIRRIPDGGQRVTYINRRYILHGFAFREDFYNPDYRRTPPTADTHDYRRTLYWNPALQLDANGHAQVRCYNGSRPASITTDAAGQTANGTLLFNK